MISHQAISPAIQEVDADLAAAFNRAQDIFQRLREKSADQVFSRVSESALAELGLGSKNMRRLTIGEVCKMLGVTRQAIYKAEKEKRLPPPDLKKSSDEKNIRAGYTLRQLEEMRTVFDKRPTPLPRDIVVGILNQKGGCQKSSTTLTLAQWLALLGYKVLVVDTDPQGSLTTYLGYKPDIDIGWEDCVAPFIMQDEKSWVEEFGRSAEELDDLRYAVKKTYFYGVDLIPASGGLLEVDIYRDLTTSAPSRLLDRLGIDEPMLPTDILSFGLAPLKSEYDVVLIDGTPSLNLSTTNVISACDEILIPTPSHMIDTASTVQFTGHIRNVFGLFMDNAGSRENLGVSFLINRYSTGEASYTAEAIIRHIFKDMVLKGMVEQSEEVRRQGNFMKTVYEAEDKSNTRALNRAIENYEEVFSEVLNRVIMGNRPIRQLTELDSLMGAALKEGGENG